MIQPNTSFSDDARVYIFPASRKFYQQELSILEDKIQQFATNDFKVDLGYALQYDRFIIFLVSEETSLSLQENDQLIGFIQSLEKELDIVLLDKVNVCFKQGDYVQMKQIPEFKKMIKNRGVSKKTIVFNNLINTKSELECCWEVPADDSWISHFF